MEFLIEILLEVLWALVEVLGEVLLQTLGEMLAEVIGHGLRETFRRPKPLVPWLATIGYVTWGALTGGISLWLFPVHFIRSPSLQLANLVLTPLVSGYVMGKLGAWRRWREQGLIRLNSFLYGFIFAFGMALVRYIWAQ